MKILLVDNYDSFTYNLSHYLQIAGAEVTVVRNNQFTEAEWNLNGYDAAVLSPGPDTPQEAGDLMPFIARHCGKKPLLGICLGMQALGLHFGWNLKHAKVPVHGKSTAVMHQNRGLFYGLPNPLQAGRYHSLVVEPHSGKSVLQIEGECAGEIMAFSSSEHLVWGIQFHPESILTPSGQQMICNWISLIRPHA